MNLLPLNLAGLDGSPPPWTGSPGTGSITLAAAQVASVIPVLAFTPLANDQILVTYDGVDMRISWTTGMPTGTTYQVYEDLSLVWWGTETFAHLPAPTTTVTIVVAAVPAVDASVDYSADLPSIPPTRALLTWLGGQYLGSNITGFNVYRVTGGTTLVGNVPVSTGNQQVGGYGFGGYGTGGYGSSAATYTWESNDLTSGTWEFGVTSVDQYGNESSMTTTTVTITAPPQPPGIPEYLYNQAAGTVILYWPPSPSTA